MPRGTHGQSLAGDPGPDCVPCEPPLAPVVLAGGVEVLDTELLLPAHVNAKTTRIAAMMMIPPKIHPLLPTRLLSCRR